MVVFFAVNNGYSSQLCTTLVSIIENNANEKLNFYVMHSSVSEENQKKITDFVHSHKNSSVQFVKIDASIFSEFKLNIQHISHETYFRFLIPHLFPTIEKGLYLDADLVINGSLKDLWNTDIEEYYCAGVKELVLNFLIPNIEKNWKSFRNVI